MSNARKQLQSWQNLLQPVRDKRELQVRLPEGAASDKAFGVQKLRPLHLNEHRRHIVFRGIYLHDRPMYFNMDSMEVSIKQVFSSPHWCLVRKALFAVLHHLIIDPLQHAQFKTIKVTHIGLERLSEWDTSIVFNHFPANQQLLSRASHSNCFLQWREESQATR